MGVVALAAKRARAGLGLLLTILLLAAGTTAMERAGALVELRDGHVVSAQFAAAGT